MREESSGGTDDRVLVDAGEGGEHAAVDVVRGGGRRCLSESEEEGRYFLCLPREKGEVSAESERERRGSTRLTK